MVTVVNMRESAMPPLQVWRIPRAKYECMVNAGAFGPEDRIELLDGFLIAREPQGSRHAVAVGLVRAALERAFGQGYHIREEKPLALDALSEPEPDLVVVRGRIRDYRDAHPSTPVLIVEIADTSLTLDRLRKGSLYARAGIADYWIVNLIDEVLEVYRQPVRSSASSDSWEYGSIKFLKRHAGVSPLAAPRVPIRVTHLLP